jgi:amino acid adenylation domain-containing protein/FkbM family methyltransferase
MKRLTDMETIAAGKGNKERNYWLNQLSGDLVKTRFPVDVDSSTALAGKDGKRENQQERTYDIYRFTITGDIFARLIKISKDSLPLLFVALLTGLVALLRRYTGSPDIIVGAPVARQGLDAKFVNTVLILRNRLERGMTFKELLLTVRQTVMEAAENQNYPLNTLLYELNIPAPEGDKDNEFPLFDIALLMENVHEKSYIRHIPVNMLIAFNRTGETIEAEVEFNPAQYQTGTIQRIFSHYERLMASALSHPDLALNELDILAAEEKKQLLDEFNNLNIEYPRHKTLDRLFAQQVQRTPDHIAVVGPLELKYRTYMSDKTYISYKELNEKSRQLALLLKERGVKSDTIVGLKVERSVEMIIGILGIIKAGGAYLPINPQYPDDRIDYVLRDSGAKILLTGQEVAGLYSPQALYLSEGHHPIFPSSHLPNFSASLPSSLAYIIYTSGSTGKPKGVMIEQRNVHNLVIGLKETIYKDYQNPLRLCLLAPYEFDASVQQIFGALLQGHSLYIVPEQTRLDGIKLLEFYQTNRVDISDGTPSHLRLLLEAVDIQAQSPQLPVRHFIIAGEAFPGKTAQRFFKNFAEPPRVSNLYGPTETCVDSTFYHICPGKIPPVQTLPIGKPLPNQQVYILDEENRLLPTGIPGELCIGGDGLARGYLNKPELTAQKFDHDLWDYQDYHDENHRSSRSHKSYITHLSYYKSGDLTRWMRDGNIEFLGRKDHQVKLRGYRIELGEIENRIRAFEAVKEAVVVLREDALGDNQLVAYVEPDPGTAPMVKRLLQMEKKSSPGSQYFEFPNGMPIFYSNLHEAQNLYREIFEEHCYWKHGIILSENACVFDLGANIGMFTIFIHYRCKGARVFCFEPLPPTCEVLRNNIQLHGIDARVFNLGVSDKDGEEAFTYFPNSPAMSGRYADPEQEIETARIFMLNRERTQDKGAELSPDQVEEIVNERLTTEVYKCPVKSLSRVIKENKIEIIDLLKIDVEKGELDVLAGIEEQDWGKIRRVVIEVHNVDGRLQGIISRMENHGYKVTCEQDTLYENTGLYNLFAVCPGETGEAGNDTGPALNTAGKWNTPGQLISGLRTYLGQQLPGYMVPSFIVPLESIPLTPNGKILREALPDLGTRQIQAQSQPPRTGIERKLQEIWSRILAVEKSAVGIDSDFFQLGGHSLKAILMISGIHKELDIKIPLISIFQNPTIRELADVITRAQTGVGDTALQDIFPVEKRQYYPLSYNQQRLYFLHHLQAESHAFHMPSSVPLDHEVDPEVMKEVLKRIIERHESFRTAFIKVDETPHQVVYKEAKILFECVDLSMMEAPLREQEQNRLYSEIVSIPFDLGRAPLFRTQLVKMEPGHFLLMFNMHHIISDGWSGEILKKEFNRLYEACSAGKEIELPRLRLQYKDFALWHNRMMAGPEGKESHRCWKEKVADGVPILRLPADREIPAEDNAGIGYQCNIDKEGKDRLKELAEAHQTTLFNVILSIYILYLSGICDQQDISCSIIAAGREHPSLDQIIGFFVNSMVFKIRVDERQPFREFLEHVKREFKSVFRHQSYPLEQVFTDLKERYPEIPAAINMFMPAEEDLPIPPELLAAESARLVEHHDVKFDLEAYITEYTDGIAVYWAYKKNMFEPATIQYILDEYKKQMEFFGKNPGQSLRDYLTGGKSKETGKFKKKSK